MSDKRYFSPVPNRAALDPRMRLIHWRVFVLVGAHARLGTNGLGCTLSARAIARKLGTQHPNVVEAIRDLVSWGYLERAPHPTHQQSFMLFQVFDPEADLAVVSRETGPREHTGFDDEPVPESIPVGDQTGPSQHTGSDETGPPQHAGLGANRSPRAYHKRETPKGEEIPLKRSEDIQPAATSRRTAARASQVESPAGCQDEDEEEHEDDGPPMSFMDIANLYRTTPLPDDDDEEI